MYFKSTITVLININTFPYNYMDISGILFWYRSQLKGDLIFLICTSKMVSWHDILSHALVS